METLKHLNVLFSEFYSTHFYYDKLYEQPNDIQTVFIHIHLPTELFDHV